VAVGVAAPLVRHRLRLRAPVVTVLSFQAPAALALATARTPVRDAGIYALQMWAYYAHYDMPDDDPVRLLARMVAYWAVPTAPPWYAGETGRMPPVRRIMVETGERFWKGLWRPLYDSLEGNPFAAMPSLHFGSSVMAARVLSQVGRGPAAIAWTYALTLGFGLVYLGEHYVIDLIGGFALAEVVRQAAPHARPAVLAAARRIQRLEPGAG
jgi:membrane-associated phospholipid phosphatase